MGMAGFFASVVRLPLCGTLVSVEMVAYASLGDRNTNLCFPILLCCMTSYVTAVYFSPDTLFEILLKQDGISEHDIKLRSTVENVEHFRGAREQLLAEAEDILSVFSDNVSKTGAKSKSNRNPESWPRTDYERVKCAFYEWKEVIKRQRRWRKHHQGASNSSRAGVNIAELHRQASPLSQNSCSSPVRSNGSAKDGATASDELVLPTAQISKESFGTGCSSHAMTSKDSFGSESTISESDAEEVRIQRRRENRELWEKVAFVLPGLSCRVWKSLDFVQRSAIAELSLIKSAHEKPAGRSETIEIRI
jgi:hypothetical protein